MTINKPDFTIKQGDTLPILRSVCLDNNGAPISLVGYASIKFNMKQLDNPDAAVIGGSAAVVGDPAQGAVSYSWGATDTQTPGLYQGEFEIIYTSGGTLTVPNGSFLVIRVTKEVL